MTVIAWCFEALQTSLGWLDKAFLAIATAALFGNAQRMVDSWPIVYKAEFHKT